MKVSQGNEGVAIAFGAIHRLLRQGGLDLSEKAELAVRAALEFSMTLDTDVYSEAFLYGLIASQSIIIPVLDSLNINAAALQASCTDSIRNTPGDPWDAHHVTDYELRTPNLVLSMAIHRAETAGRKTLYSSDLIFGLLEFTVDELQAEGLPAQEIVKAVYSDYGYSHNAPEEEDGEFFGSYFHRIIDGAGLSLARLEREVKRIRFFEPYIERVQYVVTIERDKYSIVPFSFFNVYGR